MPFGFRSTLRTPLPSRPKALSTRFLPLSGTFRIPESPGTIRSIRCTMRHDRLSPCSSTSVPPFLAFQRNLALTTGRNNVLSPFGMNDVPTDVQIRNILDSVEAKEMAPLIQGVGDTLWAEGCLSDYQVLNGSLLIALDRTDTFSSDSGIHCPSCPRDPPFGRERPASSHCGHPGSGGPRRAPGRAASPGVRRSPKMVTANRTARSGEPPAGLTPGGAPFWGTTSMPISPSARRWRRPDSITSSPVNLRPIHPHQMGRRLRPFRADRNPQASSSPGARESPKASGSTRSSGSACPFALWPIVRSATRTTPFWRTGSNSPSPMKRPAKSSA